MLLFFSNLREQDPKRCQDHRRNDIQRERERILTVHAHETAQGPYFEWVQNIQSVTWTEQEVNEKLKDIMDPAFEAVWNIAKTKDTTLRTGAYLIAVKRVVEAKAARAIWP